MIDPDAQDVLAMLQADAKPMPANQHEWLAGYREQVDGFTRFQGEAPAITVRDRTFDGPDGALRLRIYGGGENKYDLVAVFCHGGGFVAGSLDGYDVPLRWLALRSGWTIAAVDYRLAPESGYPAAVDDCWAALAHVAKGGLGGAPDRLAVIGDSAGGLLASVLARRARDAGVVLALQILLYPNADLREASSYPSRSDYDGVLIRVDELYRSLALYAAAGDRSSPDLSPVLADDLAGVCPAYVVTNEYDPLRDEGELYARNLAEAGVAVPQERLSGMIHAGLQLAAAIPAGDALIAQVAARLTATEPADLRQEP